MHVQGIDCRFLSMGPLDTKGFSTTVVKSRPTISKGNITFSGFKTGALYICIIHPRSVLSTRDLCLPAQDLHADKL